MSVVRVELDGLAELARSLEAVAADVQGGGACPALPTQGLAGLTEQLLDGVTVDAALLERGVARARRVAADLVSVVDAARSADRLTGPR